MSKLLMLLEDGNANVKLEISGEDLLTFSEDLINRAKGELAAKVEEARAERHLTKEEVKGIFDVCDTTLWHWNKRGYLKTVKTGNKVRYLKSDVDRILHNKTI
ncbi:MAG: helix-turn-helix domain-containing protein [Rikenellaceae bacterium]